VKIKSKERYQGTLTILFYADEGEGCRVLENAHQIASVLVRRIENLSLKNLHN
jgi:hypothetical protein